MRPLLLLRALVLALCILTASSVFADEKPKYFGATAADLVKAIKANKGKSLSVLFDRRNEFTANVNIQQQEFAESMAEYVKVSKKQFGEMFKQGYDLRKEEHDDDSCIIELEGTLTMNGTDFDLHFYARALKKGDRIILLTSVARTEHWEEIGPKLKRFVHSIKP